MSNKIKKLPRTDGKINPSFEANGKTYYIESSINIKRYTEFEKMQLEVGFGASFAEVFGALKNAYNLANEQKFADLAVLLYNTMNGIKKSSSERYNSALTMCTLFVNTEGENRTVWTKEEAQIKLNDWSKEGYDVNDFFLLAVNSIHNFAEAYKGLTAGIFKKNPSKES